MYYSESETLITRSPSDKSDLVLMDRAIARSYSSSGRGWLDDSALQMRTRLAAVRANNLIRRYEKLHVIRRYELLECSHGHQFDPDEVECPDCQESVASASQSGSIRYRVLIQPQEPLFDPKTAKGPYDIFISYRHGESTRLATDLYYAYSSLHMNVFLDNSNIPPGNDFEKIFLPAASSSSHFMLLASSSFFDSGYCKSELAHSLRSARNVIPIPVDSRFNPPKDMPWLNKVNVCPFVGEGQGLSKELEDYLVPIIQQSPAPLNHEHRLDACVYLLQKMGESDIYSCFATSNWLSNIIKLGTGQSNWIVSIRKEIGSNTTRLNELCSALAP